VILIGVGFITAGGADGIVGGFVGGSTLAGGAVNFADLGPQALAEDFTFLDFAENTDAMYNMISNCQKSLKNMHDSYLKAGTQLTDVLKKGAFVQRGSVVSKADVTSGVGAVAEWMKKTVVTSLINQAWKQSQVWIVFVSLYPIVCPATIPHHHFNTPMQVPYGPVLSTSPTRDPITFNQTYCEISILTDRGSDIWGSCVQGPSTKPGLGVFFNGVSLSHLSLKFVPKCDSPYMF